MNEFISSGWSYYIAIVTVVSIIACALLLWALGRKTIVSKGETTGHVWDEDLAEYNNPLPRWWVWLFYITIVFGILYLILYPGLGSRIGVLGWTQFGQYENEAQALEQRIAPLYEGFTKTPGEQLAGNAEAMAIGERLFLNNCSQCHGSDARGSRGFPNLTDNAWLYGGDHETIKATLINGRQGVMPPMAAAVGSGADVENLANYVLSLSGAAPDPVKAELGKAKFAVCAACHGADGTGNQALGAPNLTDRIWLYGGGLANVMEAINNGRSGMMPAFQGRLTDAQIHVLASYVWGLSNAPQKTSDASGAMQR